MLTQVHKQELYLAAVIEILQSIRQAEMTPLLKRVYQAEGGSELLDVLMKYMFVISIRISTIMNADR